ncbi:TPA: hypothetical protein I9080_002917 [Clostridium perfringens]|uniref:Uncharacterized protein n=1 Tax=Clostridium perfringens TaxID=1502 RepID=A0A8H9QZL5_CLOPF|nr:hypothetical protein [Clostridium perfringens]
MSDFLVYQANKNIKGTCLNKSLRKDNKVYGVFIEGDTKVRVRDKIVVYTRCGIHFYLPNELRVSKNQKLNKRILGVNSNG